jgi:hypothetical protein
LSVSLSASVSEINYLLARKKKCGNFLSQE